MPYKLLTTWMLLGPVTALAQAGDRPTNRVLFIGIDGCRVDALKAVKPAHLQSLMAEGIFSDATNIVVREMIRPTR